MFLRPTILGAALAVLVSVPAAAQQPAALADLAPCYVSAAATQRQPVDIAASNFTPLSTLDIYVDDTHAATADVAYNGTAAGTVPAPFIESGERAFPVRVVEQGNPDHTVTKWSRVTAFTVSQSPKVAKTGQHVRFRGRGFTEQNRYVYAHYVFGGKARKTVQIAYPEGPCGTFNVKRKQFPIKRPATGPWTIQFDQELVYNAKAPRQVQMTIKVKRAPKGSRHPR